MVYCKKSIELLISKLLDEEEGGELFNDLAWSLVCSLGGAGSTVIEEGDEKGEGNEDAGVARWSNQVGMNGSNSMSKSPRIDRISLHSKKGRDWEVIGLKNAKYYWNNKQMIQEG